MTAPSRTRRGTPKLSDLAKKVVAPTDITSTGWPSVRDVCKVKMGVEFDPWQDGAGRLILAKREGGKLAAMIGGVGMSIPRQVGKTYLIGAIVFALCILRPGLLVVWSAHHARTHGETFLAMQDFAKRRKVAAFIRQVFTGSGDEEIRFANGSRILFGARERGFGRGIPGVDVIVSDEAQIMTEKALDAQLATMNTSDFGLAIYVGTPPRPDDPSDAFTRMREEAWNGTLEDAVWIEFGADTDADPSDRRQWAKANPSYPHRTPTESLLRLQRKLTPDSFLREGLGVWPEESGKPWGVIPKAVWTSAGSDDVALTDPVTFALEVTSDLNRAWIAAAGASGELEAVELIDELGDSERVVSRLVELHERHGSRGVVVDERSPAAVFSPDLEVAGVPVTVPKTADVSVAALAITLGVAEGKVVYPTRTDLAPVLDSAVGAAVKRTTRETWWIDRRTNAGPFIAASLALWGHRQPVTVVESEVW